MVRLLQSEGRAVQVLNGNGDTVEVLETALADARAGRLLGCVITSVTDDNRINWTYGWNDGVQPMFALIVAGLACAQHEILTDGLEG